MPSNGDSPRWRFGGHGDRRAIVLVESSEDLRPQGLAVSTEGHDVGVGRALMAPLDVQSGVDMHPARTPGDRHGAVGSRHDGERIIQQGAVVPGGGGEQSPEAVVHPNDAPPQRVVELLVGAVASRVLRSV